MNGEVNSSFATPVVFATTTFYAAVANATGCVSARTAAIAAINPITKPVINASKSRLCSASDEVILSGPPGFAGYEWSTGETTATVSVTTAGAYSVTVVNASGCRSESSDGFVVELGAGKPVISVGTDVLVSTPAKTYQWYFGDFKIPDGTKQFLKYNPFQYGSYTVVVTDVGDCVATSDVFVNLVTAVEQPELNGILYPNPFSETLVMTVDADEARLFDATGKAIKALVKGNNDVSQLSRGLYLVRLRKGNEFKTIKISK